MGRPKGSKTISPDTKKLIAIDYEICKSYKAVANKHNIKYSTVYDIVNCNTSLNKNITDKLVNSMEIGSGIIGNLALNELQKKNLGKEKARSLSSIAVDMHKIATGNQQQSVNIQVNMPTDRSSLIEFLSKKSANIDNSGTIENNVQNDTIDNNDK